MKLRALINKRVSSLFVFLFFLPYSVSAELPIEVKQGDIVHLSVKPGPGIDSVSGRFQGKAIPFFETGEGLFTTVLGIDLAQKKGSLGFTVTWEGREKTGQKEYTINIVSAPFGIQRLTLPKNKVDLDPPTLTRVRMEKGLMKEAFEHSINEKLWRGEFLVPVQGKRQGTFGRKRILNGQPRRPHTGEDISAPQGATILATNSGKVVLVGDFFFNGRSVVIDHGLGLFSMYFHLSEVAVSNGGSVKRGDTIGRVGQSGRVTGPHLHWGMRLNGARIDPYALVSKKLD